MRARTHIFVTIEKNKIKKSAILAANITNVKFTPLKCENKSSGCELNEVPSTRKLNDKKTYLLKCALHYLLNYHIFILIFYLI